MNHCPPKMSAGVKNHLATVAILAFVMGCSSRSDTAQMETSSGSSAVTSGLADQADRSSANIHSEPSPSSDPSLRRIPGRTRATQAKDALAARLMERLIEAMVEGGPAQAVEVCSLEAQRISKQIADEMGISIGRTSFKIRNPNNSPPEWAEKWIADRVESPQFQLLSDGSTAALFPIKIQPNCLNCHGKEVPTEVQAKLNQLYPDDQATGFALDDLRGWFWVQVPAE